MIQLKKKEKKAYCYEGINGSMNGCADLPTVPLMERQPLISKQKREILPCVPLFSKPVCSKVLEMKECPSFFNIFFHLSLFVNFESWQV